MAPPITPKLISGFPSWVMKAGMIVWKRMRDRVQQLIFVVALLVISWLAMQAVINMGVNMGMLPTKGLTLPLMSYGGSSLIICCMAIGLLLRIHYECGVYANQAVNQKGGKKSPKPRTRRRKTGS